MIEASLTTAEVGLETVKLLIKEGGIASFFTLVFCALLGWQLHGQGLLIKELVAKLSAQEEAKQSEDEADKITVDYNSIGLQDQVNILQQVLTLLAQHEERLNEERISENIQQKTQAYERKSHTKP